VFTAVLISSCDVFSAVPTVLLVLRMCVLSAIVWVGTYVEYAVVVSFVCRVT
jgi:hypothetical protein